MQLLRTAVTAAVAAFLLPVTLAQAAPQNVSVSFDPVYDNQSGSMDTVACSDGQNGLITRFGTYPRCRPSWTLA